jgi:hypothetical protein
VSLTPEEQAEMEALEAALGTPKNRGVGKKGKIQQAVEPTEIIPAPPPVEWSVSDPACLVRLIDAAITADGDIAHAAAVVGCPEDISYALQTSGAWDAMWDKRCHFLITQRARVKGLKALAEKVSEDGNAYTFKVLHDTAPKEDLSEDEKRRAAAFARMAPAELLREIERREKVLVGFRERLEAGRSPPPDRLKQIQQEVVSVMDPPKRGPSAAP